MSRKVPSVRDDADAGDVLRTMLRDSGLGAAVVADDQDRLLGIVTKTDLLRALQLRAAGWDAVGESHSGGSTIRPQMQRVATEART